ncbi:MAG: tetratricopeptide repeat protein [Thermodesulfovibrio sp.]|nr:tetratricopeptide repeat protein [Thermodesulfovibrio sp.]
MINQKKDIPPGLLRIVKRGKPSKKFFLLIGFSVFLLVSGVWIVHLYSHYFSTEVITKPASSIINTQKDSSLVKIKRNEETEIAQKKETKSQNKGIKSERIEDTQRRYKDINYRFVPKELPFTSVDAFKGVDYLYRAQDFEQRGFLSDAINEYKEYINYTGKADTMILNKIAALYLLMSNLREANHYAELAVKSNQINKEVLINYGVIKAKMGELDKAEESFLKVLSIEPDNKTALFNLALLKEKKGQHKEALNLYERLYQLGDYSVAPLIEKLKSY